MKRITSLISKKLVLVIILIIIIAVAAGGVLFYNYQKQKNPDMGTQTEIGILTKKVGKLIELPKENPTIATVSDINKLKNQPFFSRAQNGDKVLIYKEAKKAIIYRPSTNQIIEVSNINLTQNNLTPSPATSQTPEKKIKVVLYNGTNIVGYTKTIEARLLGKFDNIEVVERKNASKPDYEKTIIVNVSGKNKETAGLIAKDLGGEVGNLPEGETKPDTDILVILGKTQ